VQLAVDAWREGALERVGSNDQPRLSELDGVIEQLAQATAQQPHIEQLAQATERQPQLAHARDTGIRLMQWNPHWQCFAQSPDCATNATQALASLLQEGPQGPLDFVNVVEMEVTPSYQPPAPYKALGAYQSCGHDWDTLIYDASLWTLLSNATGCMYDGRSYAIGTFRSVVDPQFTLTAVGAHYPQTLNASTHAYVDGTAALKAAIKAQAPTSGLVLMADTNTEGPEAAAAKPDHHGVNRTSAQLATDLGIWPAGSAKPPPASTLFHACCYSDGFDWQGDRIIANFGRAGASTLLFDPAPAWAAFDGSEFHKGVAFTVHRS